MADEQQQQDGGDKAPDVKVTQVDGGQSIQFQNDVEAEAQKQGDLNNQKKPEGERPEGLPEGFESWEAYAKDLAAKQDQQGNDEGDLSAEQEEAVKTNLEQFPEENREKARPFVEEVARSGDLSEESRDAAAKAFGVPREWVDRYVAGAKAEAEGPINELYAEVGGKETYDAFAEWAKANYTADQIAAFDAGLEKDAKKTVSEAVTAWKEAGFGPAARDITRKAPPEKNTAPAVEGYASTAEMQRDMNNPLYRNDPAFRAKVEAKIGASDFQLGRKV